MDEKAKLMPSFFQIILAFFCAILLQLIRTLWLEYLNSETRFVHYLPRTSRSGTYFSPELQPFAPDYLKYIDIGLQTAVLVAFLWIPLSIIFNKIYISLKLK